jgi:hypothetical protein
MIQLIEYHPAKVKDSHWILTLNLLDDTLLDEIFQERDALETCCNLRCHRKITRRSIPTPDLITLHEENKAQDFLTEKVTEEKQNLFYCSPKCKSDSERIITIVKRDPENFMFKSLSDFKFLQQYDNCRNEYDSLIEAVRIFKTLGMI